MESCPTRAFLHDLVDSCVTNHRIVREHAADCSAAPGTRCWPGGEAVTRRPRPATRGDSGRLQSASPQRGQTLRADSHVRQDLATSGTVSS